jgi:hypothetical protein
MPKGATSRDALDRFLLRSLGEAARREVLASGFAILHANGSRSLQPRWLLLTASHLLLAEQPPKRLTPLGPLVDVLDLRMPDEGHPPAYVRDRFGDLGGLHLQLVFQAATHPQPLVLPLPQPQTLTQPQPQPLTQTQTPTQPQTAATSGASQGSMCVGGGRMLHRP